MESEGETQAMIHEHPMMPWNDLRKGDCCGGFESISDGYYCKSCDFFIHKRCGEEIPNSIDHPFHPDHALLLHLRGRGNRCDICRRNIVNLFYRCQMCHFDVDVDCAMYPPPDVIDHFEMHPHKLTLLKERKDFVCDGKYGKAGDDEFSYKCHECDVTFHMDCIWHPGPELNYSPEVNHSYHLLHPLKLFKGEPPEYSDGKCCLCGGKVDKFFYHCLSCNFTLDMRCILHPPPKSLLDLKTHDHQLTLLPRLDSFTCNACGLKGDRSPYACFECGFMIHQDCLGLPCVMNVNRHDHRVSRTSILGVMNSVCGVCLQKVDWTCGGYSCQKCPGYVVHSKCATGRHVWNGKELEGVAEEDEDIEPYKRIYDDTIHHFSHDDHYLRLHGKGILYEENKRCNACICPVGLESFYSCIDCDFTLHQNCAELPRKRWHMLHNERLTLLTMEANSFTCDACRRISNGFRYKHEDWKFGVLCCSISEPVVHPNHPHHPLYCIPRDQVKKACNGCRLLKWDVLRCIENCCGFVLCFHCATLPLVVKHIVDDHPLLLCYGEKEATGKYWCDICEKETNPMEWFYTCKDHMASLHTDCVLGDLSKLMPRSIINYIDDLYEVVLNNSMTRPFCKRCKMRCRYPIVLKLLGTPATYLCSDRCLFIKRKLFSFMS